MRCIAFEPLINDMRANNIEKEHYCFEYNGFKFDVILSIVSRGYEILVAIHTHNWGCVLNMNNNYIVEMSNEDYYSLCNILHLNWSKNGFSSPVFLRLLSEKAPKFSNKKGVEYRELQSYLSYRQVDDADKMYFCGWNDHQRDHRNAHNFDKTEFFLGKTIADYCRKNNISSMWSDTPKDEKQLTKPWN